MSSAAYATASQSCAAQAALLAEGQLELTAHRDLTLSTR
jgi:hypothetical protein